MTRLALLFLLLAAPVFAQTPLALPQFADPPEANGAPYSTYNRHILWNSGQLCLQRSTANSWQCLTTQAQTDAAMSSAVSQAGSNAAATYMPTATANAAIATMNGRIDAVQASIPTVTPDTVCANATVTGLSIPLTGISTTTNITVPGAIAGYPCVVGNPSFLPLGAKGVCIASAANAVQMRFEAGGLLSSVISVPSGTYRACVLIRP
jgi:hypothetical protein